MPREGYIALWRKTLDSRIFQNEGLLKVWVWCLLKASHKKRWTALKTGRGIIEIEILPGQFIFGRHSAAKELKMVPSTVWKRIVKLKNLSSLNIKSNKQYSIINIINWDIYQIENNKSDKQVTSKNGLKNAVNPLQIDTLSSKPKHNVFVPSKVTGKNNTETIENIDKTDKESLQSNSKSNKQVTSKEQASDTDNNVNNKKKTNKRKSFLPDNYKLEKRHIEYANSKGIVDDIEDIFEGFCINHRKRGTQYVSWYATWQTWIRNKIKWDKEKQPPEYKQPSLQEQIS